MFAVSQDFINIATGDVVPPYIPYLTINGVSVAPITIEFKNLRDTYIGSFSAKQLIVEIEASDWDSSYRNGVVELSLSFAALPEEYLPIGTFYIDPEDIEYDEVASIYQFVAYDAAVQFDVTANLEALNFTEARSVNYIGEEIAALVDVPLDGQVTSVSLPLLSGVNLNEKDNASYRQLVNKLAQLTFSSAHITRTNNLQFRPFSSNQLDSEITRISAHDYFSLKIDKFNQKFNSLVYNQEGVDDPVYVQDAADIETNGLKELRIEDNFFMDYHDREWQHQVLESQFSSIQRVFHTFEMDYVVLPYLDCGDLVYVTDIDGEEYLTRIQNIEWTWNGNLRGSMSTLALPETSTNYLLSKEDQRLFDMGVRVNRAEEQIVSFIEFEDEASNKLTELAQTIDGFNFKVMDGGGSNLLKNSVGYNGLKYWTQEDVDSGAVEARTSNWILQGTSKHGFKFLGEGTLIQEFQATKNKLYTAVLKIYKPSAVGSLSVTVYNSGGEVVGTPITYAQGETADQTLVFDIVNESSSNDLYLHIYSSHEEVELTDIGIYEGTAPHSWQQNAGEVYTINVQIDEDGIAVYSDEKLSRTVMSPEEFAGYYNNEQIFTLNKYITEVMGIRIKREGLHIAPIKIVQSLEGTIKASIVWTG